MPKKATKKKARPPKPSLSEDAKFFLETGHYCISLDIRIPVRARYSNQRTIVQHIYSPIYVQLAQTVEEDGETIIEYESFQPIVETESVGEIHAWRSVGFEADELKWWCDSAHSDVSTPFEWLLNEYNDDLDLDVFEILCLSPILLDRIILAPEWRGHNIALKAAAAFLEALVPHFVFCMPAPLNPKPPNNLSEAELDRQKRLLRIYWHKLGLNHYSDKHNILWHYDWECPNWLKATREEGDWM